MQTVSAQPGTARRWWSPASLRSAAAVNSPLGVGCPVQSVISDECTSRGRADAATVALQPRSALCETARVAFTRLRRTQRSSAPSPSPRAVPQASRATRARGARRCPSVRAGLQCPSPARCWGPLPVPPPGSPFSPSSRGRRGRSEPLALPLAVSAVGA